MKAILAKDEYPALQGILAIILIGLALATGILVGGLQTVSPYISLIIIGVAVTAIITSYNNWRGLILLVLATQFNSFRFDYGQFTLRPDQIVLVLALLIWIMTFCQRKARIHSTILNIPIAGLLVTGVVSSYLYSSDPSHSYRSLFLQMVYMAMYFYTVNVLLDNRKKIDVTMKIVMAVASLHALYALVALASYSGGLNIGGISRSHVVTLSNPSTSGFFQEANLLGAFTSIMFAVYVTHLVTQKGSGIMKQRYLLAGALLLLAAALTTMTRAAWIGIIVVIPFLLFYSRPKWNVINPRAITLILVVFVGVGLIVFPVVNYVFSATSGQTNILLDRVVNIVDTESTSFTGRADIQELGWERWQKSPVIGNGVLSLRAGKITEQGWLFSTVLQGLHDTGVVGVFFVLWIHIVPVIYCLRAARRTNDRTRRASLMALSLGAVVMTIASQVSSLFWLGFPWVYLGIMVAMAKDTLDKAGKKENQLVSEVEL